MSSDERAFYSQVNTDEKEHDEYQQQKKEQMHFQRQIHNTGFWGDVRRRRGTWLVAIGVILMIIGVVMTGVFWRWWWGYRVNMPNRVVAVTSLSSGFVSIVIGLLCNYLMNSDDNSKFFLETPNNKRDGTKFRWSTWLLFTGIFLIITATVFISVYYTVWVNRFVNTPLISLSIIFYFFGLIFTIVGTYKNFKLMRRDLELLKV